MAPVTWTGPLHWEPAESGSQSSVGRCGGVSPRLRSHADEAVPGEVGGGEGGEGRGQCFRLCLLSSSCWSSLFGQTRGNTWVLSGSSVLTFSCSSGLQSDRVVEGTDGPAEGHGGHAAVHAGGYVHDEHVHLHVTSVLLVLLQRESNIVSWWLSGNVVNGTIGKQMVDMLVESSNNVEMILKFFDMFLKLKDLTSSDAFKEYDTDGKGEFSPLDFFLLLGQDQYLHSFISQRELFNKVLSVHLLETWLITLFFSSEEL